MGASNVGDPFEEMFGRDTFKMPPKSDLLDRAKVKVWFRQQHSVVLKDVDYPTNDANEKLPHGAKLDLENIPIR